MSEETIIGRARERKRQTERGKRCGKREDNAGPLKTVGAVNIHKVTSARGTADIDWTKRTIGTRASRLYLLHYHFYRPAARCRALGREGIVAAATCSPSASPPPVVEEKAVRDIARRYRGFFRRRGTAPRSNLLDARSLFIVPFPRAPSTLPAGNYNWALIIRAARPARRQPNLIDSGPRGRKGDF